MRIFLFCISFVTIFHQEFRIPIPQRQSTSVGGREFYKRILKVNRKERDSLAVLEILNGNIPSFYHRFVEIRTTLLDSAEGKEFSASYFVAPDYLSIGSDEDWVRIPMTPMAAQVIADSFDCFFPTPKMVDDIYEAAEVKLEPVPMYAFRDSAVTFWHHHLIIEGQRKERKGLIAGIKKDVVLSGEITRDSRPNRVAIYGWHRLDGNPIQPLYTGHVNRYVDYSHGIRLVYRNIKVNGRWMDFRDVMNDSQLRRLLCNEPFCDFYHY